MPFIIDLPFRTDKGDQPTVDVYPKTEPPPDDDEPQGGERFRKVDDAGQGLAGARFKLVVQARQANGDPLWDAQGNPVYQSYLMNGKEVILHSDEGGRFEIRGLPFGDYWLIETVSPTGYSLLKEPLAFTVSEFNYEDDSVVRIINMKRPPDLPLEPDDPEKPTPPESIEKPEPPDKTPPGTQVKPPTVNERPPVTIPKTGDVQTYLFLMAGLVLALVGSWLIRASKV